MIVRVIDQVIGGIPVGAPGYTPGDGYSERVCEVCETVRLWVGPQSLALKSADPNTVAILCPHCVITHLGPDAISRMSTLNPSANSTFDEQALKDAIEKGWTP